MIFTRILNSPDRLQCPDREVLLFMETASRGRLIAAHYTSNYRLSNTVIPISSGRRHFHATSSIEYITPSLIYPSYPVCKGVNAATTVTTEMSVISWKWLHHLVIAMG